MERTTVRLPEALLDRARKKAAAEKTTLTALIERGLREVVAERPPPTRKRRVKLPVSKAKGGLMPGLDPIKFVQQIQEMEDLEYIERMKRF